MKQIVRLMLLTLAAVSLQSTPLHARMLADLPEVPAPELPEAPAHPQQGGKQDVGAMKIAFFTDMLKLTPEESQKFWPLYNQYWEERGKLGQKRRVLFRAIREKQATDAQMRELLSIMDDERKLVATYAERFKSALPVDKVVRVFVADEDFKNFLVRRAAEGNSGSGSGNRSGSSR